METMTVDTATLERLVEDRIRQFNDAQGGNLNTRGNPGGPTTTDADQRPAIGTTWRGTRAPGTAIRTGLTEQQAGAVMQFLRGVYHGDSAAQRAAFESGVLHRAAGDPQQIADATLGGSTVPIEFVTEVVVQLPIFTPFADASLIRIFPMAQETAKWPKVTTKPTKPAIVAEKGQYGKSNAVFGFVELVARKIGQIIPFTEEILQGSSVPMVQLLAELVAEQLAYVRNDLVTNGTGTGEPEGVLTNTGVAEATWVGTSDETKADSLISLFHKLGPQYRRDAIWLLPDSTIELVRKLKDGQKRYLWTDGFGEAPASILGRPVFYNQDLPTDGGDGSDEATILFGNFRRGYVLGTREGLSVERNSSGADWEKDIINMKFRERYDGKVLDTAAFVKMDSVK